MLCTWPDRRLQCEHRLKHRFQTKRNTRGFQLPDGKRIGLLSAANFLNAAAGKWRFPGKRKPERSPQRVDVGTHIYWSAFELLGTRKVWCADEFTVGDIHFSSSIRDRLSQAEIDDFYLQTSHLSVTRFKHDVARL